MSRRRNTNNDDDDNFIPTASLGGSSSPTRASRVSEAEERNKWHKKKKAFRNAMKTMEESIRDFYNKIFLPKSNKIILLTKRRIQKMDLQEKQKNMFLQMTVLFFIFVISILVIRSQSSSSSSTAPQKPRTLNFNDNNNLDRPSAFRKVEQQKQQTTTMNNDSKNIPSDVQKLAVENKQSDKQSSVNNNVAGKQQGEPAAKKINNNDNNKQAVPVKKEKGGSKKEPAPTKKETGENKKAPAPAPKEKPEASPFTWLEKEDAICYAERYPNLFEGYCSGEIGEHSDSDKKCDTKGLLTHFVKHGKDAGLLYGCTRIREAICYAERYPNLLEGFCNNDVSSCDARALHTHYQRHGKDSGLKWGCDNMSPDVIAANDKKDREDAICYAENHPNLYEAFCKNDSTKCNIERLDYHYKNYGKQNGLHWGCGKNGQIQNNHALVQGNEHGSAGTDNSVGGNVVANKQDAKPIENKVNAEDSVSVPMSKDAGDAHHDHETTPMGDTNKNATSEAKDAHHDPDVPSKGIESSNSEGAISSNKDAGDSQHSHDILPEGHGDKNTDGGGSNNQVESPPGNDNHETSVDAAVSMNKDVKDAPIAIPHTNEKQETSEAEVNGGTDVKVSKAIPDAEGEKEEEIVNKDVSVGGSVNSTLDGDNHKVTAEKVAPINKDADEASGTVPVESKKEESSEAAISIPKDGIGVTDMKPSAADPVAENKNEEKGANETKETSKNGIKDSREANCYAERYPDLFDAYCPGGVCDVKALRLHFESHGKGSGLLWGCLNIEDAVCYAERYPNLHETFCGGASDQCDILGLHLHYQRHGKVQQLIWACDSPVSSDAENTGHGNSTDNKETTVAEVTTEKHFGSRYHDDVICYAERYPDLHKEFCFGDSTKCDLEHLDYHFKNKGKKEGLLWGCRPNINALCYAKRHPDLEKEFCTTNNNKTSCDTLALRQHFHDVGRTKGFVWECDKDGKDTDGGKAVA